MSQKNPVRTTITGGDRAASHRTFDERIAVRMPWLVHFIAAHIQRLPPSSHLRRRFLVRAVKRGNAALNRGDLRMNELLFYDRGVELVFPEGARGGGFVETYSGIEAAFASYREWLEPWAELRRQPKEMIDFGDRLLVIIDQRGRGAGSGLEVNEEIANVYTFRNGRIVRHEEYFSRRPALEAVGLAE
jgi:ketosteroid isomerase-like protein